MVVVNTPKAGTAHKVTISGENKIVLKSCCGGGLDMYRPVEYGLVSLQILFEAGGEAEANLQICRFSFRS